MQDSEKNDPYVGGRSLTYRKKRSPGMDGHELTELRGS